MLSVRPLQLEHLQDAGPGMQAAVAGVTTEGLNLESEGDTSLPAVLLGGELC